MILGMSWIDFLFLDCSANILLPSIRLTHAVIVFNYEILYFDYFNLKIVQFRKHEFENLMEFKHYNLSSKAIVN